MRALTIPLNEIDTTRTSARLSDLHAGEIVEWASNRFGDGLLMSTSFGVQSAIMLHLVTQVRPNNPVIWTDTGYLPAETYRFGGLKQECGIRLPADATESLAAFAA